MLAFFCFVPRPEPRTEPAPQCFLLLGQPRAFQKGVRTKSALKQKQKNSKPPPAHGLQEAPSPMQSPLNPNPPPRLPQAPGKAPGNAGYAGSLPTSSVAAPLGARAAEQGFECTGALFVLREFRVFYRFGFSIKGLGLGLGWGLLGCVWGAG